MNCNPTRLLAALSLILTLTVCATATAQIGPLEIRRCKTAEDSQNSFPLNCPLISNSAGNASVSDYSFTTTIHFSEPNRTYKERWFMPDGSLIARDYPYQEHIDISGRFGYYAGCPGTTFQLCFYDVGDTITLEHWSGFVGTLLKQHAGTWTYQEFSDDTLIEEYSFEVLPVTIAPVSGDNGIGIINEDIPIPFVFKLQSFEGIGVAGETFAWSISGPGGAKNATVLGLGVGSETDSNGIETATIHLGSKVGTYTVTLDNGRMAEPQTFTFTAIDDIEDTNPVQDHPDVEEGVGQVAQQCDSVGNPIGVSLGNKFQREIDIEQFGLSPIEFVRYHNSLGYVSYSFQNYWTHTYDRRVEVPANPQTEIVRVIRPDGKKYGFSWNGSSYAPLAGVHSALEETQSGWTFTNEDQTVETFDSSGLLLEIIDLKGRVQTATQNSNGQISRIESNTGDSLDFAYDGTGKLISVTDQAGRIWSYRYDVLGRFQFVDNPDGTFREYHYEDFRHAYALTGITDGGGLRYSTYEYDAQGMAVASYLAGDAGRVDIQYDVNGVRAVLDPLGNTTTYQSRIENKRGVLEGISGPVCSQGCGVSDAQYSYDANLNVLSKTVFGVTTEYGNYDSQGQPGYVIHAVGTAEEKRIDYEYDPRFRNRITKITEPSVFPGSFKVTDRTYDVSGNLLTETISGFDAVGQPVTRTTSNTYAGPLGQISERDGPRTDVSDVTTYEYYPNLTTEGANRGRLKAIINPNLLGIRDNIQYSPTGKILSELRPNGVSVTYEYYSGSDRIKSITESANGLFNRTQWEYRYTGEVSQIIVDDETGEEIITRFWYDNARRLSSVQSRVSRTAFGEHYSYDVKQSVSYEFDGAGNIILERAGSADISGPIDTEKIFDAYSHIEQIIQGGVTEHYVYAPDGTLTSKTDGNLNTTVYTYDAFKRLTNTDLAGVISTSTDYDVQGNTTSITDSKNQTTQYIYDDLGNLTQQTSPDTGTTTNSHNESGQLVGTIDAKGQSSTYVYDAAGQLQGADLVGTDYDVTYTYDVCTNGTGQLCSITTGWGHSIQYEYDALGQKSSVTTNEGQIKYTYGPKGTVSSIEYPSGRVIEFKRDGGEVPISINLSVSGLPSIPIVENIGYSQFQRPIRWQFANGHQTSVLLDARHRPESIDTPGVWSWTANLYDANDNILDLTLPADSYSFEYDTQNRLNVADTPTVTTSFGYDNVGNMTSKNVSGVAELGTYDVQSNRIESFGTHEYSLDANGNTVARTQNLAADRTFVYSAHNRLIEVIDDQTSTSLGQYQYDALGQRVQKTTSSGTRKFIYGLNGELLVVMNGNGEILHEYVYLNGTPVVDLSEMLVGPPPVARPEFTVDSTETAHVVVGGANWQSKTNAQAENGTYYQNRKLTDRWVTWFIDDNPDFQGGLYEIFIKWMNENQDGTQTTYIVAHVDEDGTAHIDDVVIGHAGLSVGDWVSLGIHYFRVPPPPNGRWQHIGLVGDENNSGLLGTFLQADAIKVSPIESPLDFVEPKYIQSDHLGTPQVVTDSSGQIVWSATYLPYGEATVDEDPDLDGFDYELNVRFPGQYFDAESGLHYNYFRTYDPTLGRYLESDPIGLNGGLNTYLYAEANPLKFIDILGLCSLKGNVRDCLEKIFGESVEGVEITTRLFGDEFITTRPNKIALPRGFSCEEFQSAPSLMLHEFYHVLRQWNVGELTRTKYLIEAIKNGVGNKNKYEKAANDFARENLPRYLECLSCGS